MMKFVRKEPNSKLACLPNSLVAREQIGIVFLARTNEHSAMSALPLATAFFADLSKSTLVARQAKIR